MSAHPFDLLTVEQLRRSGSLKWSEYTGTLGAWVAEMDFGTAPGVVAAAQETLANGLIGYAPTRLVNDMQQATAAWLDNRFEWKLEPGQIRPLNSVAVALDAAIMHFSPRHRPDAPVVLLTPAYMPFLATASRFGRDTIQVAMVPTQTGWDLDWSALEQALAGGSLLVLVNPHNPIGKVYSREELVAISELVEVTGSRVFVDEIHSPLVFNGASHIPYATVSPTAAAHSITAVAATKAFNLPGLKCAQLVLTNDADRQLWDHVGEVSEHGAANVGLAATTAAYRTGTGWLDGVIAYLDESRMLLADLITEHLPQVDYRPPHGTYLAWLDVSRLSLDPDPARFFLKEAQVALINGDDCGIGGQGFVRLNFATPRPVLGGMIHRMGAAVDGCDNKDVTDPEFAQ
ncbi:MAG: aminotransferase class I/II-fold pyridoxal phosphate-dependent enzyme [Micrococcaceae bacterium]|nr:aminotransferase class I/II-fold pyridoxal phosphate-dependent enzyme [Micrococcaceae bacterium]